MSETIIFSQGSFFHGTKADLKVGDFIITGKKKKTRYSPGSSKT